MIRSLLLFVPSALVPQDRNGEIRGFVTDLGGEPIYHSQVVLHGARIERTARSDKEGLYRFDDVPGGEYELTITAPFFYTMTIRTVRLQGQGIRALPVVSLILEGYDCTTRVPAYLYPLERFSSNTGALGGVIVDDRGHVLAEAKATLFVPGAGVSRSTMTDVNGRFSIFDLAARSDYKLQVVRDGYFTEEFREIRIQAGYESVYNGLDLQPCEKGRCQASLRPIRIVPHCA